MQQAGNRAALWSFIDERHIAGREQPRETTMSKIEEMTAEQTDDVVGGVAESASAKRVMQRGGTADTLAADINKTQYANRYDSVKRLEY
jgi:hypothetical protein